MCWLCPLPVPRRLVPNSLPVASCSRFDGHQHKTGGAVREAAPLRDAYGYAGLRRFTFHHLRLFLVAGHEYRPGER